MKIKVGQSEARLFGRAGESVTRSDRRERELEFESSFPPLTARPNRRREGTRGLTTQSSPLGGAPNQHETGGKTLTPVGHPFMTPSERRFAPTTVRQARNGVRYGLEQVSAFIGIRRARFRRSKGAVKLHTLLGLRGSIPTFIAVSTGKQADVSVLDELLLEAGTFYVMDRGYVDFQRLYGFVLANAFFVTRTKTNIQFNRLKSQPVDLATGLRSDQTVWLRNAKSVQHYPDNLRRIRYFDKDTGKCLVFLTNNFQLPALVIAALYKSRWQVELLFKWIKQHLRIKHFYGNSDNAVKTQIWIAVCVYVLLAILKKQLKSDLSLNTILQILSVNAFEKEPLHQLLTSIPSQLSEGNIWNQLIFNY
jgi:transposase